MGCCSSNIDVGPKSPRINQMQYDPGIVSHNNILCHVGIAAAAESSQPDTAFAVQIDFSDLISGPGCPIPDAALRAISLRQLDLVYSHMARRLKLGEVWSVTRCENNKMVQKDLTDPATAQLYDVSTHVILPATEARQLSLVEAMASSTQPPDYFVSHWSGALNILAADCIGRWGEEVVLFVYCLKQHSADRGLQQEQDRRGDPNIDYLGGRSPLYWVCAYANNQHKLNEEIGQHKPLSETSFFRAMKLSRGTVSVVDLYGVSWTRIWCVYELFQSLTQMGSNYTYDLYTAYEHVVNDNYGYSWRCGTQFAVGITQGLVAADRGDASCKAEREQYFPIDLIHRGVIFRCQDGQASVMADKQKIITEIGDNAAMLNNTIHGVVAAAALERVLRDDGNRLPEFLEAVKRSPPQQLRLDLGGSRGDTQENVTAVVKALSANGASKCEVLRLSGRGTIIFQKNFSGVASQDGTPEVILACQAVPGKHVRVAGGGSKMVSKMRCVIGWLGCPQKMMASKQLTWEAESEFRGPYGRCRMHEPLLDAFIVDVLNSTEGCARGWPFKKLPNGDNDKYVWVHPNVAPSLATHIRGHRSINTSTTEWFGKA